MSDTLGIGELITTHRERDAIHVAVVPVVAACDMNPGQKVALTPDGKVEPSKLPIGVIDPFMSSAIPAGRVCWLFLNPGSITSLRHDWTHPAFDRNREQNESKMWIENYAAAYGISFDQMISAAKEYLQYGE